MVLDDWMCVQGVGMEVGEVKMLFFDMRGQLQMTQNKKLNLDHGSIIIECVGSSGS